MNHVINSLPFKYKSLLDNHPWLVDMIWLCDMHKPYRSCQATPLLPANAVWRGKCGHRGCHWDRDRHPVSLPTRGAVGLLFFVCETQTLHYITLHYICTQATVLQPKSHLGAAPWDWTERFCAAPPNMVVGYKDETRCGAGAMEPDSEATACSLYPSLTPLRREENQIGTGFYILWSYSFKGM